MYTSRTSSPFVRPYVQVVSRVPALTYSVVRVYGEGLELPGVWEVEPPPSSCLQTLVFEFQSLGKISNINDI